MAAHPTTRASLRCAVLMSALLLDVPVLAFDDDGHPGRREGDNRGSPVQRGQDIWFNATFGGEKFFALLANSPDPRSRIDLGLRNVVETPRSERFDTWGTLNDPDCEADPNGGMDRCKDPNATGVIGIRRFPGPDGSILYGVTCAGCHAGFHPLAPPEDVNEPTWRDIHPTIGNQHLKTGKIFAANLPADDPRRIMFDAWPDGTVDTTLLFSDHIMAPGAITAFWDQRHRPTFEVETTFPGTPAEPRNPHRRPGFGVVTDRHIRNGQGGEDDVGGRLGAIRVYTNIGMCYVECVAPREDRPDPTAPIDVEQCRRDCADFPTDRELDDLVAFMRSIDAPLFPERPRDSATFREGRRVFEESCSSCHVTKGPGARVLSNDLINPLALDPFNATNACRALTSNWEAGHIWAPFSSNNYKDRAAEGLKGYRTMPLTGIWATAPFLHNQSIGPYAAPDAEPAERAKAYEAAMRELLSDARTPKIDTLPVDVGPFPAGTPLAHVFSRDPASDELLCDDVVENRGHYFGADLGEREKEALIYWLKFQ